MRHLGALMCAVALAAAGAHARCYLTGGPGFPLPVSNDSYGLCPVGYYCPNATKADPRTWPQFCPATAECVDQRSNFKLCEPQGWYEPTPCPAGYYCPNASTKLPCPRGSWCPIGSTFTRACSGLSSCPEKSKVDYFVGCILVVALVDIVVIAVVLAYRARLKAEAESVCLDVTPGELPKSIGLRREGRAPLNFEFRNLRVTVDKAKGAGEVTLLDGVNGRFAAGKVTAIMGPSGCGKSVLFDTVIGRASSDFTITGDLSANGSRDVRALRSSIGFVPQEDVLFKELTVRENVDTMSQLRLPPDFSGEQRERLVSSVLRALRLDHVQHVRIGDEEERGVSGGQRKRCNIAVELVTAPLALFLDEPTNGLDANTALEIVTQLKYVATEANIPVAMIINQPRVEIWEALDDVLLLAAGKTVFQGSRSDAEEHLRNVLNLKMDQGNPADILIDAIAANGAAAVAAWDAAQKDEKRDAPSAVVATSSTAAASDVAIAAPASASFFYQFYLCHTRSLKQQYYHKASVVMDVLLAAVSSALLATSVINTEYIGVLKGTYVLLSAKGVHFTVPMFMMFLYIAIAGAVAPSGVRTFGAIQQQYWREAGAQCNRLAFYLGASLAEFYRLLVASLHFTVVAYLMWNPPNDFWRFFLIMLLSFICADSQAVMLGMLLPVQSAPLLATVAGVFMALFNGFPNIPVINPGSYSYWATEAVASDNAEPFANIYSVKATYDNWMYTLDRFGVDVAIMIAMAVAYRVVAFLFLVLRNRDKQR
jgi:ABC-type multidrug transport system ATPase subunit